MIELKEFTKEERVIFGLDIINLERKAKKDMTKQEKKRFDIKLERLKKQREDFLKNLEE